MVVINPIAAAIRAINAIGRSDSIIPGEILANDQAHRRR